MEAVQPGGLEGCGSSTPGSGKVPMYENLRDSKSSKYGCRSTIPFFRLNASFAVVDLESIAYCTSVIVTFGISPRRLLNSLNISSTVSKEVGVGTL